jgi:hypothetical protein
MVRCCSQSPCTLSHKNVKGRTLEQGRNFVFCWYLLLSWLYSAVSALSWIRCDLSLPVVGQLRRSCWKSRYFFYTH